MLQDSVPSNMPISLDYVATLEKRILQLENQIQQFEKQLSRQETSISMVGNRLPYTSLLSPNFLTRAFTVFGHVIVAQLIITVPIYCLLFIIGMLSNY